MLNSKGESEGGGMGQFLLPYLSAALKHLVSGRIPNHYHVKASIVIKLHMSAAEKRITRISSHLQ